MSEKENGWMEEGGGASGKGEGGSWLLGLLFVLERLMSAVPDVVYVRLSTSEHPHYCLHHSPYPPTHSLKSG